MITIDQIRPCFEGVIPAFVATCSRDGVPNVAHASQVEYVDAQHVALSFQFFNKTRANILAHPHATVMVVNNETAEMFRLSLQYVRTETEGRLFQRMKVKLAGIASHTGMVGVFRLQGSDVYRVLGIERVAGSSLPALPPSRNPLQAMRAVSEQLSAMSDLGCLFEVSLQALAEQFGFAHSMFLVLDESGRQLYTVASRGYAESGVGSEIALGEGVIGVAAAYRTPIRMAYLSTEYNYALSLRESAKAAGLQACAEIPFPGLAEPHSQLAVPILSGDALLGVLYFESDRQQRFSYDDEDVMVAIANQLGLLMRTLQRAEALAETAPDAASAAAPQAGAAIVVKHYGENDSVFIGDDYLIKGVAGAIFRKLVSEYLQEGRTEFSNRALRLDPAIRLPDIDDNLEARLILLARRLRERCDFIAIEKTGRGRFRLRVDRSLQLIDGV